MLLTARVLRSSIGFAFCVAVTMGVLASNAHAASNRDDVKKAQQSLTEKGFYHGPVDGISGPQTRQAIADFQRSEHQPVTRRLDSKTAVKLNGGSQSVGRDFKGTGSEVKEGSKEAGHDVSKGKPVA